MTQREEKQLFLFTVLDKNPNNICLNDFQKKTVTAKAEKFDFQTLNFVHNFCNSNSCYYSAIGQREEVLLIINFL